MTWSASMTATPRPELAGWPSARAGRTRLLLLSCLVQVIVQREVWWRPKNGATRPLSCMLSSTTPRRPRARGGPRGWRKQRRLGACDRSRAFGGPDAGEAVLERGVVQDMDLRSWSAGETGYAVVRGDDAVDGRVVGAQEEDAAGPGLSSLICPPEAGAVDRADQVVGGVVRRELGRRMDVDRRRTLERLGGVMGVPADQPAGPGVQAVKLGPGGIPRSARRRRPSGKPPPLPRPLRTTGVGWLTAAVVLVVLSVLVFAGELRDTAVAVTVVDDAIVGWLAGLRAPGLLRGDGAGRRAGVVGGYHRAAVGAAVGPVDPEARAAAGGRRDRLDPAGRDHPVRAGARCCVDRDRSGWSSGRTGVHGRCRPSRWRRWRSRWSGSCTGWCRRAVGDKTRQVGRGRLVAMVAVAHRLPGSGGAHRCAGGCGRSA